MPLDNKFCCSLCYHCHSIYLSVNYATSQPNRRMGRPTPRDRGPRQDIFFVTHLVSSFSCFFSWQTFSTLIVTSLSMTDVVMTVVSCEEVMNKLAMSQTYSDRTCSHRKKVVETLSKELYLLNISLALNGLSGYKDDLICAKTIFSQREKPWKMSS